MALTPSETDHITWKPQPKAAQLVARLVEAAESECPAAAELAQRMHAETGTRFGDWVDFLALPAEDSLVEELQSVGFQQDPRVPNGEVWRHPDGLFPRIRLQEDGKKRVGIKVESVVDFLLAHGFDSRREILGGPGASLRTATVGTSPVWELLVVERHGEPGFVPQELTAEQSAAVQQHFEAFRLRPRSFDDPAEGFRMALNFIEHAKSDLGTDRACDLFFAAEREYWQRRNQAARVQKARQDRLGLGWANHDHHTYRSSRIWFNHLIRVLAALGFNCRERFYAGREAGWGAQVLEQPNAGIVVFADVDLAPEEVSGDFAHDPLPWQESYGTVGFWCQLHGEAFLEAGMHHLEAEFDFDAAREQLAAEGIPTMKPFTDFDYLKQAFTTVEVWQVPEHRLQKLQAAGTITEEQAEQFRREGAIGSHLEILQRDDGYQGFNQTGINEIIRDTDPRRQAESGSLDN